MPNESMCYDVHIIFTQKMKKQTFYIFIAAFVVVAGITTIFAKILTSKPAELTLPIPFSTQAPNGNWDGNENCEETSAVMANAYLNGNTQEEIPPTDAQKGIDELVQWEQQNFHHNANTGAAETAHMIEAVLHLKTNIITNFTADDLKNAIKNHQVILLPLNAQSLAPDNYPEFQPTYHMVVVTGYENENFTVNDPGTSKGENNKYLFAQLQAASSDWDSANKKIDAAKKLALIVYK